MPSESNRPFPPRGSCLFGLIVGIQLLPDGVTASAEVPLDRIGLGMRELIFAKELGHVVACDGANLPRKGFLVGMGCKKWSVNSTAWRSRARRIAAAASSRSARWPATPAAFLSVFGAGSRCGGDPGACPAGG